MTVKISIITCTCYTVPGEAGSVGVLGARAGDGGRRERQRKIPGEHGVLVLTRVRSY